MNKSIYILALACITLFASCGKIDDAYELEEDELLTYKKANWVEVADKGTLGLLQFWYPVTNKQGELGGYFGHGASGANPGFNYWLQAQALDVLVDAYNRTDNEQEKSKYVDYINKWYIGIQAKHSRTNNIDDVKNFEDNFVDDMEWIGLAALRVYQSIGDVRFLRVAEHMWKCIFEDPRGYNESAPYNGGVFWLLNGSGKNACSNGPASLLSMKFYLETGEAKYLDYAKRVYVWERKYLYEPTSGAVYDNISINESTGVVKIQKVALSYNQGTFLGTALELYKATGDKIYLDDAKLAANYTIGRKVTSGTRVLSGEGSEQNQIFRGIFIRSFLELTRYEGLDAKTRARYTDAMERFSQYIWQVGSDPYNIDADRTALMFSDNWDKAPEGYEFSKQMSGCMLLDAMNQLVEGGYIANQH